MTSQSAGRLAAGEARRATRGASRAAGRRRQGAVGLTMALPPVIVIAVFVGLPIVLAVGLSLGFTGGLNSTVAEIGTGTIVADHWWGSVGAYQELFADPRFGRDLVTTIIVTVAGTAATIVLAVAAALFLRLRGGRLGAFVAGLAVVPLFIPVVIASWAIYSFYDQQGFVRTLFATFGLTGPVLAFTVTGIVVGSVWTSLPFATLMAASGIQSVPSGVIEAAKDAGAGLWTIVFRVILPMAKMPLIIATTFTAIGTLGQFTVPYFLGPTAPQVLGVDINSYFQSYNKPQESVVVAVVIFVLAAGIACVYVWANFRGSATRDGRGTR